MLKALDYREHIQRKAQKNKPLSGCQKRRNTRIAKMRHMGGKLLRTIDQARAALPPCCLSPRPTMTKRKPWKTARQEA